MRSSATNDSYPCAGNIVAQERERLAGLKATLDKLKDSWRGSTVDTLPFDPSRLDQSDACAVASDLFAVVVKLPEA